MPRPLRTTLPYVFAAVTAVPGAAGATTYYLSAAGSDANAGTSMTAPWQSIAKLDASMSALHPGDSVLLRRGDSFYGGIVVTQSGAAGLPITFGSYGSGADAVITGFTHLTAWTAAGINLWQVPVPSTAARLTDIVVAGVVQQIARFPRAAAPDSGYLTIDSHTSESSFTDSDIPASPSLVGAEIVLRMSESRFYRTTVLTHTGHTVSFTAYSAAGYPLLDGRTGYFFQDHASMLTANGDWYYDAAAHVLHAYNTGTPPAVEAPTVQQLVTMSNVHDVVFTDLDFEGSNGPMFQADHGSDVTLQSSTLHAAGSFAVDVMYSPNVLVQDNTITDSVSDGIYVYGSGSSGATVQRNTVTNTGTLAGMNECGRESNQGIAVTVSDTALIDQNTVTSTGYIPVRFQGNDVHVTRNVIDRYDFVLDDGGGVYTWNGTLPTTHYTGRVIDSNVISNGVGAPNGSIANHPQGTGIYLDQNTTGVAVTNNTVFAMSLLGAQLNCPQDVTISGNTFFATPLAESVTRWVDAAGDGIDIQRLDFHDNVIVSTQPLQEVFKFSDHGYDYPTASTAMARLTSIGTIDHDYLYLGEPRTFSWDSRADAASPTMYSPWMGLAQWRDTASFERTAVVVPLRAGYTIASMDTPNLYPAGTFESALSSVFAYSATGPSAIARDTTGKLDGPGSLRLTLTGVPPADRNDTLIYSHFGGVEASKQYVVRVSTFGTTAWGLIGATFRMTDSPSADLAPAQYQAFGVGRTDHEFLIDAPTTDPNASWELAVRETSGTTYLDDMQIYEVHATHHAAGSDVRLEYNNTAAPRAVALDATYVDARGVAYCGSTTLAPYSSVVLFSSTAPCVPPSGDGGVAIDGGGDGSVAMGSDGSLAMGDGALGDGGRVLVDDGAMGPPAAPHTGCACSVPAAGARDGWPLGAMSALAVWWRARRSRSQRSRPLVRR